MGENVWANMMEKMERSAYGTKDSVPGLSFGHQW